MIEHHMTIIIFKCKLWLLLLWKKLTELASDMNLGALFQFAAIRLATTGKPVPSGPLLGLSAVTSVVFALSYLQTRVLLP